MKTRESKKDKKPTVAVIGGGIFGITSALLLARDFKVSVFERRRDILGEATWANQYRHHAGYHYPRSPRTIEEILETTEDFERFYKKIIIKRFPSFYAVAKEGSLISADEFLSVCDRFGLKFKQSWPPPEFLNRKMVSLCGKTSEAIYDWRGLRKFLKIKIKQNRAVSLSLASEVAGVKINQSGAKTLIIERSGKRIKRDFDFVVNATYANFNSLSQWLGIERPEFHYRLKEIAVVRINHPRQVGVTIVDGPFATYLPTGQENFYTFGDVPLSVHEEYFSRDDAGKIENKLLKLKTRWPQMKERCRRWFPLVDKMDYSHSMFVILPVEPASDQTDARPTRVENHGCGCWSILSGKIITCVSNAKSLRQEIKKAAGIL